jgi:hypothetical protein
MNNPPNDAMLDVMLTQFKELHDFLDTKFEVIDDRFVRIETRVTSIEGRLSGLERKVDVLGEKMRAGFAAIDRRRDRNR